MTLEDQLYAQMRLLERKTIKKMAIIGRMIRNALRKWADDADLLEKQIDLLKIKINDLEKKIQ